MAVCVPMGPVKGKDADQAELAAAAVCVARSGAASADRRDRAWRRWARGPRAVTPSASTPSSASLSTLRADHTQVPLAVCAVGGYGRKSQFLHSDIDLLVVFGGSIGRPEERFVKALLHPLWDLRFQVGHHVRELADFDRLDATNPEYLLALMDLRPLAGDRELMDRLGRLDEVVGAGVATADSRRARDAHRQAPWGFRRHAVPARARREGRTRVRCAMCGRLE